jgi:hypothetical protein
MGTRYKLSFVSFVILIASGAMATTVQVGNCMPHVTTYSTISQAVSAAPPGSSVLVCPGTYAEQVVISKPLTLRGVISGNTANPTITVPSGGLTQSVVLNNGATMFFQVLAQGSASDQINISNIAVNGSGNRVSSNGWLSGICYRAASGSVSHAAIFNQTGNGNGWGIFLESGGPPSMSTVSLTDNSIHDFDDEGIRSNANSTPPSLTVNIKGNSVVISNSPTLYASATAIDIDGVGVISGNRVLGLSSGIGIAFLSNLSVSNNTIEQVGIGLWEIGDSNTIDSNEVSVVQAGIILSGESNDVAHNSLMNITGGYAIGFNCTGTLNTVIHNTINDAWWGTASDPGGNIVTPNLFSNVTYISASGC